jgi:hypothetical protein
MGLIATLSIMTHAIVKFSKMTFIMMGLIATLSIMTYAILKLSKMTLIMMGLIATLFSDDAQRSETQH